MRVNVQQPDGGNAIFNTVTDQFVEFDSPIREYSETYDWQDALYMAIGAEMRISDSVQMAIDKGLVSKARCEIILKEMEESFDA